MPDTVEVRAFGPLCRALTGLGLCLPVQMEAKPAQTAIDLARELGLQPEEIEAVFINGVVHTIADEVRPGDRVAFVPPGTPGPYRLLLGFLNKASK